MVERILLPSGARAWRKVFGPGRGFDQALRAYTHVAPRWGVRTPTLIDHEPQTRTLVLSDLAGRPATMHDPPSWFGAAGVALRALHDLPCPADPSDLPLDVALARRASGTPEVRRMVTRYADRLRVPRRWCHRDYQPQNWMIGETGLGVLDFEHVRPDHPLVDWVRLEARGWSAAQRAAFEAAYGTPDAVALRCVLAVYGAATVAWATTHTDAELLEIGQRALDRANP